MRFTIIFRAFLLMLLFASLSYSGDEAPDFTLQNLKGEKVTLADYKGKVLLLNFWATWCPPCRMEIPYFNDFYKKYKDKGFEVLGVSLDRGGTGVVEKFKESSEIAYPVVMGDNQVTDTYQQFIPSDQRNAIPFTFILDREGNVVKTYVGSREKEVFEKDILEVIGK